MTSVAMSRITRLRLRAKNSAKRAAIPGRDTDIDTNSAEMAANGKAGYTSPVRAGWKKFRYRLEWLAVKAGGKLVPLLSRRACSRRGRLVGNLAAKLDRRNFRVALSNLEAAFGDTFSATQREEIARESYRQFARTVFDLFWIPALTSENFWRYA